MKVAQHTCMLNFIGDILSLLLNLNIYSIMSFGFVALDFMQTKLNLKLETHKEITLMAMKCKS